MSRNKRKIALLMVAFMSLMMLGDMEVVKADIPYASPWGKFYREPEYQNNFGRCWYDERNNCTYFDIYLEGYYNNGSATSIKYYYKKNGQTKVKRVEDNQITSGSSMCVYTKDVDGTFVKAEIYGAARGISVSKTYNK